MGPVLFALRLWASVCLALYVAFALQLSDPSWAGTTAALVCQPQLGASMRKATFRLIGTAVGGVAIVVIAALFPQDRVGFLSGLALWSAACGFVGALLRNFAAYGAGLAGFTAAVIASDVFGPTGGANDQVFLLALIRVVEITVGIVSAGVVLALTDLGGARRLLGGELATVAADALSGFAASVSAADPLEPASRALRREVHAAGDRARSADRHRYRRSLRPPLPFAHSSGRSERTGRGDLGLADAGAASRPPLRDKSGAGPRAGRPNPARAGGDAGRSRARTRPSARRLRPGGAGCGAGRRLLPVVAIARRLRRPSPHRPVARAQRRDAGRRPRGRTTRGRVGPASRPRLAAPGDRRLEGFPDRGPRFAVLDRDRLVERPARAHLCDRDRRPHSPAGRPGLRRRDAVPARLLR